LHKRSAPCASGCTTAGARHRLSHGRVRRKLDALGDERREPLPSSAVEVQAIRDALLARDANAEPAGAGAKIRFALDNGAQRIGSGDFRHGQILWGVLT